MLQVMRQRDVLGSTCPGSLHTHTHTHTALCHLIPAHHMPGLWHRCPFLP